MKGRRARIVFTPELAFIAFIAVIVIVLLIFSFEGKDDKEVIFGGVLANTDVNAAGRDYLTDGVLGLFDGDGNTQKAALTFTTFTSTSDIDRINGAYNAAMEPIAMIEKGDLDYIIMNEDAMMFYMTQYALADLREIFSEEELNALGDRVIYLEMEKEGTREPVAIRSGDFAFFQDCVDVREPVFTAFTGPSQACADMRAFWEYLMEWESKDG